MQDIIDDIMKFLNKLFPNLDPSIKRALIAIVTLGILLLLLVSLPFALGLIILALIIYFIWKRYPLK